MYYLTNFFHLISISRRVFQANDEKRLYHRKVRQKGRNLISESRKLNDGVLDEKFFRKIQWYMVSTLFMGELLAGLIGVRLTGTMQKRLVYLGATGGISDILIDDYRYSADQMKNLVNLHSPPSNQAVERIFLLYLKNLLELLDDKQKKPMETALNELFHWQAESLKQFDGKISAAEVEEITMGKGGLSIVLCFLVLTSEVKKAYQPLYKLGGFIQLMNDTQDLYKDVREGIKTYICFKPGYRDVFEYIERKRRETFSSIMDLDYPEARKSRFLLYFFAMYTGIIYKLKTYAGATAGELDFEKIKTMGKEEFRVNPFSWRAFVFCFPRIIGFRNP